MKPSNQFSKLPKNFWANVRSLSQVVGYSKRGEIVVPTALQMTQAYDKLSLDSSSIYKSGCLTGFGEQLQEYFKYRAQILHEEVEPNLMNAAEAKHEFYSMKAERDWLCPLPMNKQKEEKKDYNFLTGLVNMSIEKQIGSRTCDYDPRSLTTITLNGEPLRTLARRVDGTYPTTVNPKAIWEIKEYYYTTTFGSRIADGVYETLLDGLELEELRDSEGIHIDHYLMVDAYKTWWDMGKSYLCRMVDMVNMGVVDEVLFGRQVISEMPRICSKWIETN